MTICLHYGSPVVGTDARRMIATSRAIDRLCSTFKTVYVQHISEKFAWNCWGRTSRVPVVAYLLSLTRRVKLTSTGPVIKMFINRWLWVLRIFTVRARSCSYVGKPLEESQHTKETHYDIICINYWRCDAIIWLNTPNELGACQLMCSYMLFMQPPV